MKEKAGRITFIPLNTIRVKPVKYPVGEDGQPLNETVPILERIDPVDPKFMKALESVGLPARTANVRCTVVRSCVRGWKQPLN